MTHPSNAAPTKNAQSHCTAKFGCDNQHFTKNPLDPPICTARDGDLNYRSAWHTDLGFPVPLMSQRKMGPPLREAQGDASDRSEIAGDARGGQAARFPHSREMPLIVPLSPPWERVRVEGERAAMGLGRSRIKLPNPVLFIHDPFTTAHYQSTTSI